MWVFLLFLINRHNWKRYIIMVLFFHWLFKVIGDCFYYNQYFIKSDFPDYWPYGNKKHLYSQGIASIFWFLSEIIGDWYPLFRVAAIIKNHKKIRCVFYACLCCNFIKVEQMYNYVSYVPFGRSEYPKDDNDETIKADYFERISNYKASQWINVVFQLIFSVIYDITVIYSLRKHLFNKIKMNNTSTRENRFLTRFKLISEYRIYISLIATIIGFPILLAYAIYIMIILVTKKQEIKGANEVESIRSCILTINYTFMYIDQILLRFFVDENNESMKNSKSSSTTDNFNLVYHNYNNDKSYQNVNEFGHPNNSNNTDYSSTCSLTNHNNIISHTIYNKNNVNNYQYNNEYDNYITTNNNNNNKNNNNNNNNRSTGISRKNSKVSDIHLEYYN